jgi:hypothetical protein
MNLVDLAVNGAMGANADSDDRAPHDVASAVAAEIARGATIEDACAAAVVAPDRYVLWTIEHDTVGEMHAKALRVRAAILADAPLALARALKGVREGSRALPVGVRLGEYGKALEAEARLTASTQGVGQNDRAQGAPRVHITFDALPDHLRLPPTVAASVGEAPGASDASDDAATDYVIVERDALDD